MIRRFRSFAAGLGLVGALASCGGDGPVDPGNGGTPVGAPLVVLSGLVDGRAPLDYSGRAVATPREGQAIDSVVVTVGDERFSSVGSSVDFAGVLDNRSSGVLNQNVVARAYPSVGSVGSASQSVSVLPAFVEQPFLVRGFDLAHWASDSSSVVNVPGALESGVMRIGDSEIPFENGVGVISSSDSLLAGQYVARIVLPNRPLFDLDVLVEHRDDSVRIGVPADWSMYEHDYDVLWGFLSNMPSDATPLTRRLGRWHFDEPRVALYDGWARGPNPAGGPGMFELTPELVGADSASKIRFPEHIVADIVDAVRTQVPLYTQYCALPVFFESEGADLPDLRSVASNDFPGWHLNWRRTNNFFGIDRASRYSGVHEVLRTRMSYATNSDNISIRATRVDTHQGFMNVHYPTGNAPETVALRNILLDDTLPGGGRGSGLPTDFTLRMRGFVAGLPAGTLFTRTDGPLSEWVLRSNNSHAPASADRPLVSWEPCGDGVGHYVPLEHRVPAPTRLLLPDN